MIRQIYSTAGVRYSDTFKATIDSASLTGNVLDIKFSATGTLGSLTASAIKPTVLVGLYGYDTKDFLVAAHGSTVIDGASQESGICRRGNAPPLLRTRPRSAGK